MLLHLNTQNNGLFKIHNVDVVIWAPSGQLELHICAVIIYAWISARDDWRP